MNWKTSKERIKCLKVKKQKYRVTGVDVERKKDAIEISMKDYTESLEEIK